tara:strand:+ start:403 stop:558 length:156 start_codon:yes stop_codon:yes gene_type:complete
LCSTRYLTTSKNPFSHAIYKGVTLSTLKQAQEEEEEEEEKNKKNKKSTRYQ